MIENHTLPGESGQRSLRARIAYPDGEGPFPLVVYSHGFNCYRDSYSGLTDHWASHGYAVVLPEHPDCPTSQARLSPEDVRNLLYIRISDVARVLDALFAPGQEIPGLTGRIDYERKAIAGHSFGGMIAQVTWSQPLKDLHSTEKVRYALGFDAAIVMSGVGQMPQMAEGSFNETPRTGAGHRWHAGYRQYGRADCLPLGVANVGLRPEPAGSQVLGDSGTRRSLSWRADLPRGSWRAREQGRRARYGRDWRSWPALRQRFLMRG